MPYDYARLYRPEKHFPLWVVKLRQNWNFDDTIKHEGEFKTIRLFYTKRAAEFFVNGLNMLLERIEDVPE